MDLIAKAISDVAVESYRMILYSRRHVSSYESFDARNP